MEFAIIIGAGLGLALLIAGLVRAPGWSLAAKFRGLGDMTGKTDEEIIAACGEPTATSPTGGKVLMQWQRAGYHIAIVFDRHQFAGIRHEHSK